MAWLEGYRYRRRIELIPIFEQTYWWDYEYLVTGRNSINIWQAATIIGVESTEVAITKYDGETQVAIHEVKSWRQNETALAAGALLDPPQPADLEALIDTFEANTIAPDALLDFPAFIQNDEDAGVCYIYWGRTTAEPFDPLQEEYWDLFDHFDGAAVDTGKWAPSESGTGTLTQAASKLVFTIPNSASDLSILSVDTFTRGLDVTMLVIPVSNSFGGADTMVFECGLTSADKKILFRFTGSVDAPVWSIYVLDGAGSHTKTLSAIWAVTDEIKVRITFQETGVFRIWIDDVEYDLPDGCQADDADDLKVFIASRIAGAYSYNLESEVDYVFLAEDAAAGDTDDDGDDESSEDDYTDDSEETEEYGVGVLVNRIGNMIDDVLFRIEDPFGEGPYNVDK